MKIDPTIASNIQADTSGLSTVVKPTQSALPEQLATVIEGADKVDTHLRLAGAKEEQQGILKQFDEDLEKGVNTEAIEKFAAENPAVKELSSELSKLNAAKQQGMAKRMLGLRAEAAINRSIAAAPGLRAELRGIAQQTLGFDPSGATMKILLDSGSQKSTSKDPNAALAAKLQSHAVSNGLSTLNKDGTAMNIQQLEAQRTHFTGLEKLVEQSETATADNVDAIVDAINQVHTLKASNISNVFTNLAAGVTNKEDWKLFKGEAAVKAGHFVTMYTNSVNDAYAKIKTKGLSDETLDRVERSRKRALQPAESLQASIEAENYTSFEQRANLITVLDRDAKMDFSENFATVDWLMKNFSSFVQGASTTILAHDMQLREDTTGIIRDALSKEEVKKKSFVDYLSVMNNKVPLDSYNSEERKNIATMAWRSLEYAQKHPDLAMSTPQSLDEVGNAYAVVLQSFNSGNPDEVRAAQKLLVSDAFIGIQDKLAEHEGGAIKSEMIADSGLAMVVNYMHTAGVQDAQKQADLVGATVEFDLDTGKFILGTKEDRSSLASGSRYGALKRKQATGKVQQALENLNKSAAAFHSYRKHDDYLSSLTHEEAIQVALLKPLEAKGIKVHGVPKVIETPTPAEKRKSDSRDYAAEVTRFTDTLSELRTQMQTAGLSTDALDSIDPAAAAESTSAISKAENTEIDIAKHVAANPSFEATVTRMRKKGRPDEAILDAIEIYLEDKAAGQSSKDSLKDLGIDLNK